MRPAVVWITGLPAARKTTLALAVADEFRAGDRGACCIDGDDLRATVSQDLDFGRGDRGANARGEVAVVSLVSPFRHDRDPARRGAARRGPP